MKDAGLHPIPVFHQDERFEWLEKMITDGERYIALSPSLHARRKEKSRWLKSCFKFVPSRVKVHLLGETSAAIIERWRHRLESVDSTTWVLSSAYRRLIVPRYGADNRPDFSLLPRSIEVTYRPSASGIHIENLDRDRVHQWLDEVGVRLTRVRNDQYKRYYANLVYFSRLEAATGVRIYHATHPGNLDQRGALNRALIKHRLVSYFDFMDAREDELRRCLNQTNQWYSDRYREKRRLAIHMRNVDYESRLDPDDDYGTC